MAASSTPTKTSVSQWSYKIAKSTIYPTSLPAINDRIAAMQPLWAHTYAGVVPVTHASCSPLYLCVAADELRASEVLEGPRDHYTSFTSPVSDEVATAVVWATAITLSRLHARGVVHGHVQLGVVHHHVADVRRVVLLQAELPLSAMVPQGALGQEARRYAAPEILGGTPYGAAADVWGLGVLLLQLIAGSAQLSATSSPTSTADLVDSDLLSPLLSTLSPSAASFVLPCLKGDPMSRPVLGALLQHPFLADSAAAMAVSAGDASSPSRRSSGVAAESEEESDVESASAGST